MKILFQSLPQGAGARFIFNSLESRSNVDNYNQHENLSTFTDKEVKNMNGNSVDGVSTGPHVDFLMHFLEDQGYSDLRGEGGRDFKEKEKESGFIYGPRMEAAIKKFQAENVPYFQSPEGRAEAANIPERAQTQYGSVREMMTAIPAAERQDLYEELFPEHVGDGQTVYKHGAELNGAANRRLFGKMTELYNLSQQTPEPNGIVGPETWEVILGMARSQEIVRTNTRLVQLRQEFIPEEATQTQYNDINHMKREISGARRQELYARFFPEENPEDFQYSTGLTAAANAKLLRKLTEIHNLQATHEARNYLIPEEAKTFYPTFKDMERQIQPPIVRQKLYKDLFPKSERIAQYKQGYGLTDRANLQLWNKMTELYREHHDLSDTILEDAKTPYSNVPDMVKKIPGIRRQELYRQFFNPPRIPAWKENKGLTREANKKLFEKLAELYAQHETTLDVGAIKTDPETSRGVEITRLEATLNSVEDLYKMMESFTNTDLESFATDLAEKYGKTSEQVQEALKAAGFISEEGVANDKVFDQVRNIGLWDSENLMSSISEHSVIAPEYNNIVLLHNLLSDQNDRLGSLQQQYENYVRNGHVLSREAHVSLSHTASDIYGDDTLDLDELTDDWWENFTQFFGARDVRDEVEILQDPEKSLPEKSAARDRAFRILTEDYFDDLGDEYRKIKREREEADIKKHREKWNIDRDENIIWRRVDRDLKTPPGEREQKLANALTPIMGASISVSNINWASVDYQSVAHSLRNLGGEKDLKVASGIEALDRMDIIADTADAFADGRKAAPRVRPDHIARVQMPAFESFSDRTAGSLILNQPENVDENYHGNFDEAFAAVHSTGEVPDIYTALTQQYKTLEPNANNPEESKSTMQLIAESVSQPMEFENDDGDIRNYNGLELTTDEWRGMMNSLQTLEGADYAELKSNRLSQIASKTAGFGSDEDVQSFERAVAAGEPILRGKTEISFKIAGDRTITQPVEMYFTKNGMNPLVYFPGVEQTIRQLPGGKLIEEQKFNAVTLVLWAAGTKFIIDSLAGSSSSSSAATSTAKNSGLPEGGVAI